MTYNKRYIFFCINQRPNSKCCNNAGAKELSDYAKILSKNLNLEIYRVRVNFTGCLGRCSEGPVLVIYPDSVWYTYLTTADIDEIFSSHIQNHTIVDRLFISN